MESKNPSLLTLNGVPHDLAMLRLLSAAAPLIEVKLEELNPFEGPNASPYHRVDITPVDRTALEEQPVVFRQDGKYTVLLGRSVVFIKATAAKDKPLKARLISTPVLKKCRIEDEQAATQEPHGSAGRRFSEHGGRFDRDSRMKYGDDREWSGVRSLSKESQLLLEQEAERLKQRNQALQIQEPGSVRESERPQFPEYDRQPRPPMRRQMARR